MIRKLILLSFVCIAAAQNDPDNWWKSANIYQISPVSFKDSNNDGYGDIQGIISKLDHLVETGIDVIFLSPIYTTPFKDFGYDISNYLEIDEKFGSMADIQELFTKAKQKGLKVIIDFVPNLTSNEHDWFKKSENSERGYENFYIWHDGIPTVNTGRPKPPNDWESVYGGSCWEWSQKREAYYYHAFSKEQPDLNLREQRVIDELDKVLKFWLEKGADGFRIDAVSQLFEDPAFLTNPDIMKDLPQTYELVEKWRKLVDNYTLEKGGDNRILVPQVWDSNLEALVKYYGKKNETEIAQIPTNFGLINELGQRSKAGDYKKVIDEYMKALPDGATPNWFLGTHDHSRVASRMDPRRLPSLTSLLLTLPGVAFTYNGDEIAMIDNREISWDDTTDPWACNAFPDDFNEVSRDPARTPYQWDATTNAGFNTGAKPWLPVHSDYTKNNLEAQKKDEKSHFNYYKNLLKLRKTFDDNVFALEAPTDNVLALIRGVEDDKDSALVILVNLGNRTETVNVRQLTKNLQLDTFEDGAETLLASSTSFDVGTKLNPQEVTLSAFDAAILKRSDASKTTLSLLTIVLLIVKLLL